LGVGLEDGGVSALPAAGRRERVVRERVVEDGGREEGGREEIGTPLSIL
jgi:hypothetical protein